MASSLAEILEKFDLNAKAPGNDIESAEKQFGFPLPSDYKRFMKVNDGGEGFVGEHYMILWRAGELIEFNRDYEVGKYAPGLVLFGSNGGGEGFAFDSRPGENMKVKVVPFIGMSLSDAKTVGDSFENFLFRLAEDDGALF